MSMRKYYSDYVRHCTRYYFYQEKAPSPISDRVSYNNYAAVSNVLGKNPPEVVGMIRMLYQADSMVQAVEDYSKISNIKIPVIWHTVQNYEKEVAIERGLI